MAMKEFNLIEEQWIPCVRVDGKSIDCSIRETLTKAHELREILDPSPLVTTALYRLLLAVLYRALGGIKDFKAWRVIYQRDRFDANKINAYLDKWRDRFYLTHERYPFYQMACLETSEPVTVARLATELASGNNPTLFDHTYENGDFYFTYPEAAKYLVACQAFALGFGKSGTAKINAINENRPYSKDAPALRGMNIWLQGKTLFHTLAINLSFFDDNSLPPWEIDDPHIKRDNNKSTGVVDILTWQSRLIRLIADAGKVERMFFTQGRPSDKEDTKDPMKVYMRVKKGCSPLSLEEGKAAWRDSHTIFMTRDPESGEKRPECFNLVSRAIAEGVLPEDELFTTHVSGLAISQGKAGKFILWRHERLPLPVILLKPDFLERLGSLTRKAETAAENLRGRMRRILITYLEPENKPVNQEELNRILQSLDPLPQYWARLEPHFYDLIRLLPQDWDYERGGWKDDEDLKAANEWCRWIKMEAERALEESLKMLGNTARAVRAIAQVGTRFKDKDLGNS